MSLLLSEDALTARAAVARGGLSSLAASLAADLDAVIARPLHVPETKALLSREGGRCATDGSMLEFDPFSPRAHRCPRCGVSYEGALHDLFWNYWYHLWLSERCVHAALLGRLGVEARGAQFAAAILERYCDIYPRYPNVDNALGPSRPFFSTYLESIWLLQLCVAADLLEGIGDHGAVGSRFRDVIVEPSRALIASYDEGTSNRQVWNNAAMMAASRLLGRDAEVELLLRAGSGVVSHLGDALLPDGTWYEGENYHLFAHRGLWYSVRMAEAAGFEIPAELLARFERGFVTPFLTSLPDLTFPSRRDSQYAISLRQWRFAELCELGLAGGSQRTLQGILHRLYATDIPHIDTGRWKSTAEAERNLPATALTRADLGWKSLLFATGKPADGRGAALGSVLLESQGIGVIRRDDDRLYVALDYGISGGGHGHPDRLNLVLMNGETRILDDVGTGSYVDPSLHWYRSTLAHNAPLVDGRSQARVDGALVAFEDRGGAGWIAAAAPIARDCIARRTVVVMPDYLLDEVRWSSREARQLDLPMHIDAVPVDARPPAPGELAGSQGLEDGYRFLRDARRIATLAAGETIALVSPHADVWLASDVPVELWRAIAPGAPGTHEGPMLLVRARGEHGSIRSVVSWKHQVRRVDLFPRVVVETSDERHEHERVEHGAKVEIHVGGARSSIDLEGLAPAAEMAQAMARGLHELAEFPLMAENRLATGEFLHGVLGVESYRRSEQSWEEAGSPTAAIRFVNTAGALVITATVAADRTFVPPGSTNRLDNEPADINGAGLQLYLRSGERSAGFVVVPIAGTDTLTFRPIEGWGDAIPVSGAWRQTVDGYEIELRVQPPAPALSVALIVNEKPEGRERRRGQLVLGGAKDEWVYLRGDRYEGRYFVHVRLDDA